MAKLERLADFDREFGLCMQDLNLVARLREDQLLERTRALNGARPHLFNAVSQLVDRNR
jgi:hypothetical protein